MDDALKQRSHATPVPAGAEHAEAISRLHGDLFDPSWDVATVTAQLAHPGAFAMVAAEGGRVCGFILGRVAADEVEIHSIGVAADHRRRGIASMLVAASITQAAERGATRIYLEVADDNAGAINLYMKSGFEVAGRRRAYYERKGRPPADAILMSREVSLCR